MARTPSLERLHGSSQGPLEKLDQRHWPQLRVHFVPDRPGPLIGLHAIHARCGACWVDRWPGARAGLTFTGGNLTFWGNPDALSPVSLSGIVAELLREWDRVLIEVRPGFEAVTSSALPELRRWSRVILVHESERAAASPVGAELRRLTRSDTDAVRRLAAPIEWISDTYGGAAGLAGTGTAWGAFVDGRLASIAAPYFVGDRYEDIGVVTEPDLRGRGLSTACTARLIADVRARRRWASWSTSLDNRASRRVAEKLGLVEHRNDALYVAGQALPEEHARPSAA